MRSEMHKSLQTSEFLNAGYIVYLKIFNFFYIEALHEFTKAANQ
jgi:hypothetical protein